MQSEQNGLASTDEADIQRLEIAGKSFTILGTAHISQESVDLVKRVIAEERPDCVCIELDARRFEALSKGNRWESLDLKQIIREKQLSTLIVNISLSSYQKRLGIQTGVMPGKELYQAAESARELKIPVELCDRDIGITLKRAWRLTPFMKRMDLLGALFASLFEKTKIDEKSLHELRQPDSLQPMLEELGKAMPSLKQVLIDERDIYLAEKMRAASGQRIVAVVGAGHLSGMIKALQSEKRADLQVITQVPPISPLWSWLGWSLPVLILAGLVAIGLSKGWGEAGASGLTWILATGVPGAIGAILALSHPLTILAAFVSAPFTTLSPLIGVGHVTALVQAYFSPPRVRDFHQVGEEINKPLFWWKNRLLKVFLAFVLPSIGTSIGMYVGAVKIFGKLF